MEEETSMTVFIEGIGIAEYRSFGSEMQRIGPFGKINLFVGKNNSGKSNILRFLTNHLRTFTSLIVKPNRQILVDLSALDRHLGSTSNRTKFALGFDPAQLDFGQNGLLKR